MQNIPNPKKIWNEDKNKPVRKNRILLFLSVIVFVGALSILSIYLYNSKLNPNKVTVSKTTQTSQAKGVTNPQTKPETAVNYEKNEEKRKEELKEFYVPLPKEPVKRVKLEDNVRGAYLSWDVAISPFKEENIKTFEEYVKGLYAGNTPNEDKVKHINQLERILATANVSELNSLVIDIKTDWGKLTINSNIPLANKMDSDQPGSDNSAMKKLLAYCYDHGIYTLARIVTFKDPIMSKAMPEHSLSLKDGGKPYVDHQGLTWVNPYDKYIWKYVIAVAKEASLMSFNEVHFDYVRFPDNAAHYNPLVDFKVPAGTRKDDNIAGFLAMARKELEPYNIKTSAAIFGTTVRSFEDFPEDIGQTWRKIVDNVDRVSPMMYPSHFGQGWFDLEFPDAKPYEVMKAGMLLGLEKSSMAKNPGTITPWIQAFTASWVKGYIKYTPDVIAKQIQGSQSVGVDSYLLWNASGYYDPLIFKYEHEKYKEDPNIDIAGRNVSQTIKNYFTAYENKNWGRIFILTPNDEKTYDYDAFRKKMEEKGIKFTGFTVEDNLVAGNIDILLSYTGKGKTMRNEKITIEVKKENGIFKVRIPELPFTTQP